MKKQKKPFLKKVKRISEPELIEEKKELHILPDKHEQIIDDILFI